MTFDIKFIQKSAKNHQHLISVFVGMVFAKQAGCIKLANAMLQAYPLFRIKLR